MINLELKNYVDWKVNGVKRIKKGYGYIVVLILPNGEKKYQQKSGFKTVRDAEKARNITIGELYSGHYVVFSDLSVADFMDFWLEEDIKKRVRSYETYYSYYEMVKNHIKPNIGSLKLCALVGSDIISLYEKMVSYSISVAKQVRTIMKTAMRYAEANKLTALDPAKGIKLPVKGKKTGYRTRNIDTKKTFNLEQILTLIEKSKDTKIHMMVLFNVLMGLRRSEIIAVKYSDIDYVNHTLKVEVQLGRKMEGERTDYAPKTLTKQEIPPKTKSSVRNLPIPDYVFEAIMQEREIYERNKRRRSTAFQDLDYICCSSYGRPRCKTYHYQYYRELIEECGLPYIRWHDLRSTFCTLLLKNNFNPKAVSKLMGHSKEIITMDVYGDNKEIIEDGVPEIEAFMAEVLPIKTRGKVNDQSDIMPDVSEYFKQNTYLK